MEKNLLLAAIMGVAVGDALGLPVQFYSRERCQRMHVTQMLDWEFPNGTYSDDTAMTLCTLLVLRKMIGSLMKRILWSVLWPGLVMVI